MMVAKKRIAAIALLLVIMVGIASAATLKATAGFGDAKVYDNSYKLVRNPSQVSDGYVIRTAGDSLVLSGDNVRIEILPNSLARIIRLGKSPELYLLDGQAEVYSSVTFMVRTTVINYKAEAGSTIYVITDDNNETAYVKTFPAVATNLITGKSTTINPGKYVDRTEKAEAQAPAQQSPAQTVPVQTEPVEQQPASPAPQQPAPETEPVAEPDRVMMSRTIWYKGVSATITAMDGEAVIEYPPYVTETEMIDALQAVFAQYPEIAGEIFITFGEPGIMYAYYPAEYGEDGFNVAFSIIERELPPYLDELMETYAAQAAEQAEAEAEAAAQTAAEPAGKEVLVPYETVPAATQPEQQPAQQPAEPAPAQTETKIEEPAPAAEPEPLIWMFSYRGIDATVKAYIGLAYVTYPAAITEQEIDTAAAALVATYPEYTAGITYEVLRPGLAAIYYPETYGPDEFNFATGILNKELRPYIDWVLGSAEPAETAVATAEAEPAAPVAEEPAQAEPVAAAEPVKTPIETSPRPVGQEQPEQQPEEEKKGFSFGMTIGVIAGFGTDGDYYYAPSVLDNRLGMFAKNITATIDPEIRIGNFTLGLHLNLEVKSGKLVNPFPFSTEGITKTVSSIMHYISRFGFRTDNGVFEISAARNVELEFRSPIHESFKIGFEKEDRLTLTAAVRAGSFTFSGFFEDLEFKNKLNGRSEYAGARASYTLPMLEVGISTAVDVKHGLKNMIFYPGADIVVPITTAAGQQIEISAQVAVQILSGKMNAILAKATVDTITKDWLVLGVGVAYNYKSHINEIMNNGPVDVVVQYYGDSIDITGRAGVILGPFSFIGKATLPLRLNSTNGKLVYNAVLTRSGRLAYITADTMDLKAELNLGDFDFSVGVIYNGFAGRLSNFFKALIKKEGRVQTLKALLDPEFATYYALATYATEIGGVTFETFARADLMRVEGTLTIPVSAGFGIAF